MPWMIDFIIITVPPHTQYADAMNAWLADNPEWEPMDWEASVEHRTVYLKVKSKGDN